MVWCTYCGRRFSRLEHLDRHIHTHTTVNPYKCPTCQFASRRRDLLHRHQILAHKYLDHCASGVETMMLQRRSIACVACARAKTKCDKLIPSCSRCVAKGLVCEGRATRRTTDVAFRQAKHSLSLYKNKSDSQATLTLEEPLNSPDITASRAELVPIRPQPLMQRVTSEPRTPEYQSGLTYEMYASENYSSPSLSPQFGTSILPANIDSSMLLGGKDFDLLQSTSPFEDDLTGRSSWGYASEQNMPFFNTVSGQVSLEHLQFPYGVDLGYSANTSQSMAPIAPDPYLQVPSIPPFRHGERNTSHPTEESVATSTENESSSIVGWNMI